MKRAALGDVVRYRGTICEVVGIAEGKTVILREVGQKPCPTCHRPPNHELLEHAPLFQSEVEAVHTVGPT